MLVLLGSNHRSAPVEFRERIAARCADGPAAIERMVAREGIHEGLIVSTCNRFELLAVVDAGGGAEVLRQMLRDDWGLESKQIDRYCYHQEGREAVRHLFRVASGLDSMILGEPQILGQVKQAYLQAREHGGTGPVLEPLLQRCLAAAKRVRTETGISRDPVSVASTAVQLARSIFGDLAGRAALLIGSGKMSALVARHLKARGVERLLVAGRTYNNAAALAEEVGGIALNWDDGLESIGDVDIVVSCTAAPAQIISKEHVARLSRKRRGDPLFMIDIAVPRDIDPEVNRLKNVYLYDIDGLQGVVDSNLEERKSAARQADELISAQVDAFDRWWQSRAVNQLVVALKSRLTEVGRTEVARMRRKFGPISEEQQAAIEQLTHGMIGKLLHLPIRHLKSAAQRGKVDEVHALYRELFGIEVVELDHETDEADEVDGDERRGDSPENQEPGPGPRRALRGGKDQ